MEPIEDSATLVTSLKDWFKQPMTTPMSVWGWFLLTGLILVACIFWNIILHEIRGAI